MSDAVIGLLGACVGGVAAIVGAWVQSWSAARTTRLGLEAGEREAADEREREAQRRRQDLAARYLFGLQESTESLRRRLENWASRGGRQVADAADPGYWDITTLYVVARPLAFERILALEGVYPALEADLPDLVDFFGSHGVESVLADVLSEKLFRYHRLALAEAALERDTESFRVITYSEFRRRYEDPKWGLDRLLDPATRALNSLTESDMNDLVAGLREIVERLESATSVPRKRLVQSDG